MKNWFWIILAIVVMVILVFLAKDDQKVPSGKVVFDSIEKPRGRDQDAKIPSFDAPVTNKKYKPSEDFKGKSYAKCLEMVYEWDDARLIDANSSGMVRLKFKVNNHIHELDFIDDICVNDVIVKE